jgi:hypothetical protein
VSLKFKVQSSKLKNLGIGALFSFWTPISSGLGSIIHGEDGVNLEL